MDHATADFPIDATKVVGVQFSYMNELYSTPLPSSFCSAGMNQFPGYPDGLRNFTSLGTTIDPMTTSVVRVEMNVYDDPDLPE